MKLKSIKFWLNVVTIAALLLLVIFARKQVIDAFKTFADLNILWMLFIIPLQLFNHYSVAKFYQSYLKTLGEHIKTKELFKVSLEMNFVNNVFPSGGVSGFGYLGIRLKKLGVRGSKSTLVQTSRHILTFLSIIVFLVVGLLFLSMFGTASRLVILIASGLTSFIVFLTLVLIYIISDEKRIKQATVALPKLLNSFIGIFNKKKKQVIDIHRVEDMFGELHLDYLHVRKNWRDLRHPLKWTMFMNLTEILTIFVVYLAFGEVVNPGAIIIAYPIANIAGLVAILPGGIGVYEGLMTAVMAATGVRKALALSATVVYRVFNMAIFLPIGYILYHRSLQTEAGLEIEEMLEESRTDQIGD